MDEETAKRVKKMEEYRDIPMELLHRHRGLVNEITNCNYSAGINSAVGECDSAFEKLIKVLFG